MTESMKRQARLQGLVILIACAATLACVQKPVVPSGAARVPINSDEVIQQYRERVKSDQHEKQERSLLTRQVDSLTQQVHELSTALTLLQLQQQELAKGKTRSGRTITAAALTFNPLSPESKGPLTIAPLPRENGASPAASDQSRSRTETAQSEEERSASVGAACSITPSATPSSSSPPPILDEQTDSWRPRVIELSKREQIELHRHSIIFRVSERTGRSEFLPSKPLQSHLKQIMRNGPCLHVRGYTDGDKDRWIEHETAKQRAYKARAYLIAQGYAPNHIQITVVPIGEHVADNATKKGRAKNRRVEIEVKEHNPGSIWPQWYG
jgi:outer membrane protein OmpA-like peptidoglycan-associated protein